MEDKKKDDLNETVIVPAGNWVPINFVEIWNYREMIVMLVKREVQGKYRQSVLGYSWAFIPPVMQMIIFTFIFGMANIVFSPHRRMILRRKTKNV